MRERAFGAAVEFGDLFRRKLVVEFFAQVLKDGALFFKWKPVHLLQNLRCTHGLNLLRWLTGASRVFPPCREPFFNFGKHLFRWNSRMRIFLKFGDASVKFGNLLRRQIGVIRFKLILEFIPETFQNLLFLFRWQRTDLFNYFGHGHGGNLLRRFTRASRVFHRRKFGNRQSAIGNFPMIPREILKKIRQIELRTNRIVTETLAGQYHSVFKGQGMNFDEVREYQPGDDVRAIDWNVTARMNHPFIKKFVEERELTLMLVVDVSGSGLFGSRGQSKRELAAEIASVLAFSAIRNNDKVGLILFSDEVEKFIPPRKGRSHVLRVIREVLFFEPRRRGTDLNAALEFLLRVQSHKAIAVVVSDFLGSAAVPRKPGEMRARSNMLLLESLAQASFTMLRQANRKHDLVAVQIYDPHELQLPALGRLIFQDAETGEIVEVNTGDARKRAAFADRQAKSQEDLARLFRKAGIDAMQLRTDQDYGAILGKFFENREKRRLRG